jgi:transposase-like protein
MDTRKYRRYSKEFKLEALGLLESSGKSVAALEPVMNYEREVAKSD